MTTTKQANSNTVAYAAKTVDYTGKVITANDGASLLSVTTTLGQKGLFFKCRGLYERDYADCIGKLNRGGPKIHGKMARPLSTELDCTGRGNFDGITPEFHLLRNLHDALPENVAVPIAIVRRTELLEHESTWNIVDGCSVAGYITEYISGQPLDAYYNRAMTGNHTAVESFIGLVKQLMEVLNKLHTKGLGHGDPHFKNVMVADGGVLKLVDPMPLNLILTEYSNLKHRERARVFAYLHDPELQYADGARIFAYLQINRDKWMISSMERMLEYTAKHGAPDSNRP